MSAEARRAKEDQLSTPARRSSQSAGGNHLVDERHAAGASRNYPGRLSAIRD